MEGWQEEEGGRRRNPAGQSRAAHIAGERRLQLRWRVGPG